MHILIATDGTIDAAAAADVVARLHEPGDEVTIVTAIQFPREFLTKVAKVTGADDVAKFAREAGAGVLGIAGGAKAAERAAATTKDAPEHPLGDYFDVTARERTSELADLIKAQGIEVVAMWAATENQTARTVLDIAAERGADLLVIGSDRSGKRERPLGSTLTKIVRRSPIHVVIVR